MVENKGFAQRLKELRKKAGFTQEGLAEATKISAMTVRRWEWGQRIPRMDEIQQLAEVLHVSESELLNGPDDVKVKVTLVYSLSEMKDGVIDMGSNGFDLFLGKNGQIGLRGAAMLTSKDAIEEILAQIRRQLEIGLETQVRRGVIPEA